MQAGHAKTSCIISLVMPDQKIECLAHNKVLFTPMCATCRVARQLCLSLVGTTIRLPLSIRPSTTISSSQ